MSDTHTIQIQINGETHRVATGGSLIDLMTSLGLPPQAALVEYNGKALLRAEWRDVALAEGDRLEVMRVVAGG